MRGKLKRLKQNKRKRRTRAKIRGTSKRPRLSVFRSNRYIFAQLIDDVKGVTLLSVSEKERKSKKKPSSKDKGSETLSRKMNNARKVGVKLAEKAIKMKISNVVFDKGGYKYHGRVKQVAEGARKGGLKL